MGCKLGPTLGVPVGSNVVGSKVGLRVGVTVGVAVGKSVGRNDGSYHKNRWNQVQNYPEKVQLFFESESFLSLWYVQL